MPQLVKPRFRKRRGHAVSKASKRRWKRRQKRVIALMMAYWFGLSGPFAAMLVRRKLLSS